MISPHCFEEAWIRDQAVALKARDLRTLEKNILALELVGRFRHAGLEFIFKGGTALSLLFDPVKRLSGQRKTTRKSTFSVTASARWTATFSINRFNGLSRGLPPGEPP